MVCSIALPLKRVRYFYYFFFFLYQQKLSHQTGSREKHKEKFFNFLVSRGVREFDQQQQQKQQHLFLITMFQSSINRPLKSSVLTSVRYGSLRPRKTASKFVQVQLLQDIPNVGVKGQLKLVKPGFMKNFLYTDNKAVYVNANLPPRIPIVEPVQAPKPVKAKVKEVKKVVETEPEETTEAGAMSLEELSDLFSSMKGKSKRSSSKVTKGDLKVQVSTLDFDTVNDSAAAPGLEMDDTQIDKVYEIADKLPKLITINADRLPFGKEVVVDTIKRLSGASNVGEFEISYIDTPEEILENITEVGRYRIKLISSDGKTSLDQTLEVEDATK